MPGWEVVDPLVTKVYLPTCGRFDARDQPQYRGLTATAWADDHEELVLLYVKVYSSHRQGRIPTTSRAGEALGEPLYPESLLPVGPVKLLVSPFTPNPPKEGVGLAS